MHCFKFAIWESAISPFVCLKGNWNAMDESHNSTMRSIHRCYSHRPKTEHMIPRRNCILSMAVEFVHIIIPIRSIRMKHLGVMRSVILNPNEIHVTLTAMLDAQFTRIWVINYDYKPVNNAIEPMAKILARFWLMIFYHNQSCFRHFIDQATATH